MESYYSLEDYKYYDEMEAYPLLRNLMGPEYADATSEDIETFFYELYGEDVIPEDMEFAWGALISAIPAVVSAVGSIVQAATRSSGRRSRPPVRRPVQRPGPPSTPPARPAQTQMIANQILNTIMNPQFLNALLSILSGLAERGQVRTSRGETIPLEEYMNLLRVLAEDYMEASALDVDDRPVELSYLENETVDPTVPEERAAVLQEVIAEDNKAFLENFADLLDEFENIDTIEFADAYMAG
jgi:hypothetical protein